MASKSSAVDVGLELAAVLLDGDVVDLIHMMYIYRYIMIYIIFYIVEIDVTEFFSLLMILLGLLRMLLMMFMLLSSMKERFRAGLHEEFLSLI